MRIKHPEKHYKYRVRRRAKRDYRSMVTDILAFQYWVYANCKSIHADVKFPQFEFLCAIDRLVTYKERPVTCFELSVHMGRRLDLCSRMLRRMMKTGIVTKINNTQWSITHLGGSVIKRYNIVFNKFLSGEITDPRQ